MQHARCSLRRLQRDTIDLWQLHRIDPEIPLEEQFGAIGELRDWAPSASIELSEDDLRQLSLA